MSLFILQVTVRGEDDLQDHVSHVLEVLTKTHHVLGATQLICMDNLSASSDLLLTLADYSPRWMEAIQNTTTAGWSSDPAPVTMTRVEFWYVLGGAVSIYVASCLLCVWVGFKMGRKVERPEVFLPSGRQAFSVSVCLSGNLCI